MTKPITNSPIKQTQEQRSEALNQDYQYGAAAVVAIGIIATIAAAAGGALNTLSTAAMTAIQVVGGTLALVGAVALGALHMKPTEAKPTEHEKRAADLLSQKQSLKNSGEYRAYLRERYREINADNLFAMRVMPDPVLAGKCIGTAVIHTPNKHSVRDKQIALCQCTEELWLDKKISAEYAKGLVQSALKEADFTLKDLFAKGLIRRDFVSAFSEPGTASPSLPS